MRSCQYGVDPRRRGGDSGCSRDVLHRELRAYNVFTRKYFYPLCADYDCYRNLPSAAPGNLPVATRAVREVLCVPLYGSARRSRTSTGSATWLSSSVKMPGARWRRPRQNEAHLVRHSGLPQRARRHADLPADPAGAAPPSWRPTATRSSSSTTGQTMGRCRNCWRCAAPIRTCGSFRSRRNFGQMAAILAGLKQATGDLIIQLSADLQDPIGLVPQMMAALRGRLGGGRLPPRASRGRAVQSR